MWKEVLVTIKELPEEQRYGQKLCKKVNLASSHVRNIIPWLENQGMIKIKPGSKIKHLILTGKGETIISDILRLKKDMKK